MSSGDEEKHVTRNYFRGWILKRLSGCLELADWGNYFSPPNYTEYSLCCLCQAPVLLKSKLGIRGNQIDSICIRSHISCNHSPVNI